MTGQNGKKTISNIGKSRGTLCSGVPVGLVMQLTTQQEINLLIRLSSSVLAFQRFILVAVRVFSAATMRDTAFPLPKVRGYAPKCGFAHNRMNGLKLRLMSHNMRRSALWYDKRACARVAHNTSHTNSG